MLRLANQVVVSGEENRLQENATVRATRIVVSKVMVVGRRSVTTNTTLMTPVVALSIGWYKGGDRCHKYITINGNGRSVKAMVVDECDSTMGCDGDHDYQPPCPNNIVDASKAVWKALGVSEDNWGDLDITWTE
ncbi:unnamed protein product [Lactuca saligna]|uniref:Uncharacterized protein n=1 Tax=Lactuca saligna TaxID=75948 RepID=A0AA36E1Z6_LACSI|nr:unnamed protein product [Lactuca saligna]